MYQTDLNDKEWNLIQDYFQLKDRRGVKAKRPKRSIVNAIIYINKIGTQWRMLPKDLSLIIKI